MRIAVKKGLVMASDLEGLSASLDLDGYFLFMLQSWKPSGVAHGYGKCSRAFLIFQEVHNSQEKP